MEMLVVMVVVMMVVMVVVMMVMLMVVICTHTHTHTHTHLRPHGAAPQLHQLSVPSETEGEVGGPGVEVSEGGGGGE